MKKSIIILFVGICLIQVALPYLMYEIGMVSVRENFKARYKRHQSELMHLVFKVDMQLEWEKPGKEFKFNDKRYDVLSVKDSEDCKVYLVYPDTKEDRLVAQLKKALSPEEDKSQALLKKFKKLVLFNDMVFDMIFKQGTIDSEWSDFAVERLSRHFLEVAEPPPDFLLI